MLGLNLPAPGLDDNQPCAAQPALGRGLAPGRRRGRRPFVRGCRPGRERRRTRRRRITVTPRDRQPAHEHISNHSGPAARHRFRRYRPRRVAPRQSLRRTSRSRPTQSRPPRGARSGHAARTKPRSSTSQRFPRAATNAPSMSRTPPASANNSKTATTARTSKPLALAAAYEPRSTRNPRATDTSAHLQDCGMHPAGTLRSRRLYRWIFGVTVVVGIALVLLLH